MAVVLDKTPFGPFPSTANRLPAYLPPESRLIGGGPGNDSSVSTRSGAGAYASGRSGRYESSSTNWMPPADVWPEMEVGLEEEEQRRWQRR